MAGHSKWANIKHKKASQDAKRSKNFQKISKEIMVAIKEKGVDPSTNSKLRLAIEKAKAQNIPNDNIKKLLVKSNKDDATYSELIYEGYGPEGVAILVETLTENVNRTSANIRSIFNKANGNLGSHGSVAYLFENQGIIIIEKEKYSNINLIEKAFEMDIIDIQDESDVVIIKTTPGNIFKVGEQFKEIGVDEFVEFEVTKVPITVVSATPELEAKIQNLIDKLEDDDDVQKVYSNLE